MKRLKVTAGEQPGADKRKTREDWIAAARKVLANFGVEGVKVDRLATDLSTTRGSFYWHFEDREDLLQAVLDDWEAANYHAMADVRVRWARSRPDLTELVECWISEGPESPAFGMAIRIWARNDAAVEEVMHRVDNEWINLVQAVFEPDIADASERLVRARIVYFHQVGYHALALREDYSERVRLVPYYYKVLAGREGGASLRKALRALERGAGSTANRKPLAPSRKQTRPQRTAKKPSAQATQGKDA